MNYLDYSEIKGLLRLYEDRFSSSLNSRQKTIITTIINKLDDLDDISKEIVILISQLFPESIFSADENGVVTFGPFRMQLTPADPNIPVKLDNATVALSPGISKTSNNADTIKMEKKLKRAAVEFYHVANKTVQLVRELPPPLSSFECHRIWEVRNLLIEHSEREDDRPIYDSFSYSKNEGPFIKGLRIGNQTKYMDGGFKINNEDFISKLRGILLNALK